jgi:hypothetical protein
VGGDTGAVAHARTRAVARGGAHAGMGGDAGAGACGSAIVVVHTPGNGRPTSTRGYTCQSDMRESKEGNTYT